MSQEQALSRAEVTQLLAELDAQGIVHYKVAVFDIDGIMRGKYMSREKFASALEKGFGFCDVVLGWDSSDELYSTTQLSGWQTGYRDASVQLLADTRRKLVIEDATVILIGEFRGGYEAICPRSVLRRVVERASAQGLFVRAAAEYEFFLFEESPESIREKNYQNLRPITPGMFGYSMLRSGVHHEFYHQMLREFAAMDCSLEGLHTETGPGVIEAAIAHDEMMRAADKAALFKTMVKVMAQRRGWLATFMAKWSSSLPGQSGHLHLSLERENKNVFFAPDGGMSPLFQQFIAGQVRYLPDVLAMVCPTINAYRRLVPGTWAPTHANFGVENRTAAIRAITGSPEATRSEYRIGPADANPYLAFAAALASGLRGIEEELPPVLPIEGNGYENPGKGSVPLARDLREATADFAKSEMTRSMFGDDFVEHFSATRREECDKFDRAVTDFELRRYFEII